MRGESPQQEQLLTDKTGAPGLVPAEAGVVRPDVHGDVRIDLVIPSNPQ